MLEQTSKRGISVAGILLVPPTGDAGTLLKHPDFNGIAPYTMPNMTTIGLQIVTLQHLTSWQKDIVTLICA